MSETSIFFTVRTDNPDGEPVVVCEIYRGTALQNEVGRHVMTVEGARIRLHDFMAAIAEAEQKRDGRSSPVQPYTVYGIWVGGAAEVAGVVQGIHPALDSQDLNTCGETDGELQRWCEVVEATDPDEAATMASQRLEAQA